MKVYWIGRPLQQDLEPIVGYRLVRERYLPLRLLVIASSTLAASYGAFSIMTLGRISDKTAFAYAAAIAAAYGCHSLFLCLSP